MTTTELKPRPRLPEWLRIKLPTSDRFAQTRNLLGELKLHTVCESAQCPNHWECWEKGTATFMIAGDRDWKSTRPELQSPCNLVCRLLLEKNKKGQDLLAGEVPHHNALRLGDTLHLG